MAYFHSDRAFIRACTAEDAAYVAANLREEDRAEVTALTGMDPRIVLPAYIAEGREVQAGGLIVDDLPQLIWGVDPIFGLEDKAAVIWMLSTPVLYDHAQVFLPYSKRVWDAYHERFELLTNFTDARNTRHHKWLQWLGAKIIRRVEHFGAESRPFLEFASFRCV